jgi:hypothetical protein
MTAAGLLLLAAVFSGALAASAQDNPLFWKKPVEIKRVEKKRRVYRPRPKRPARRPAVEQEPLLAIQWRVLKLNDDGSQSETNPGAVFYPGDRLRLAVKANQDGYLYIIHQKAPDQDGQIVFPDSRLNNGQNFVTRDQEFIVPSKCPAGINPRDCALIVTPPSGQEFFTVIFSRDLMLDLPNKAIEAGGAIKPEVLRQLKAESGQELKRQQGVGANRYAIYVVNTNAENNEELIETLVLNKGGQ